MLQVGPSRLPAGFILFNDKLLCLKSLFVSFFSSQATAEANNLAAVAAAKDLYNKKMEEVSSIFSALSVVFFYPVMQPGTS